LSERLISNRKILAQVAEQTGDPVSRRPTERLTMKSTESSGSDIKSEENWWDYCPICNARLIDQKCKYVCSNPQCNFFMSCSEFDL
jgi:hypothetical protein